MLFSSIFGGFFLGGCEIRIIWRQLIFLGASPVSMIGKPKRRCYNETCFLFEIAFLHMFHLQLFASTLTFLPQHFSCGLFVWGLCRYIALPRMVPCYRWRGGGTMPWSKFGRFSMVCERNSLTTFPWIQLGGGGFTNKLFFGGIFIQPEIWGILESNLTDAHIFQLGCFETTN